jgi:hypothetical protein
MKSLLLVLCIGVLFLCRPTFVQNSSPGPKAIPAKSDGQTSFEALKSLAGTWTGRVTTDPANPDIDGPIQVTMRVASRGNVLVHEIAPGGVPEPTMIYLDNDRLTLVHYCEAGNRPRMVARKSPDPKVVEFNFVDISGSTMPVYLHDFVFTIIDANHHTEDWTFKLPGDQLLHAHFDLKRGGESVPPSAGK